MAKGATRADDDLITTDDVLDRLEAYPALKRAVASCVLPAQRVNDLVYFRSGDLEGWIRRQLDARLHDEAAKTGGRGAQK